MKRAVFAIIAVVVVSWGAVLASQESGSIRGTVLDEHGKAVSGAQVTARQTDVDESGEHSAITAADGRFEISKLPWGKYKVGAQKEEAGYPDMNQPFYSDQAEHAPISLSPSTPNSDLKLTLKGGTAVLTGIVTDAVSNDPIRATFLLRRADHPENMLTVDVQSAYKILVPSNADIKLEVSAPGYKTWYYPGTIDWTKATPLRIKATEPMKVDVQMDRELQGS